MMSQSSRDEFVNAKVGMSYEAVQNYVRHIAIPGMEQDDIFQEIMEKLIIYFDDCFVRGIDPLQGAVIRIARRTIYQLIRDTLMFDNCKISTRLLRRALSVPLSNNIPIDGAEIDLFEWIGTSANTPDNSVASDEFLEKFEENLTPAERSIYKYMLIGCLKPRQICAAMYGGLDLVKQKNISRHMLSIQRKFMRFWEQEYGYEPSIRTGHSRSNN